jgi:acyl dehydratase
MNPVFDMLGTMAMLPLMYSQALFAQALQWQREQADAMTKLVASVTGRESFGEGTVKRCPEDADLFVGKTVSHTKTLTDMHTLFFGLLSLDFNPLHFNDELAQRTRFGGRIAHGFHTASLFSGVLAELTPWCVYLHQAMDFTAPVRHGDVITATGTIEEIDGKGQIHAALICTNQHNDVVVRGKAVVKKLREVYRPANPAA